MVRRYAENWCTIEGVDYLDRARELIAHNNADFVHKESERLKPFFNAIMKYPLNKEQLQCCLLDEYRTLVNAGAGSGKTSVIAAKVAYLVTQMNVKTDEILLMTLTNKAADEMSERIHSKLNNDDITALTFHKFAMHIIRRYSNNPYDIADESLMGDVVHKHFSCETDQPKLEMVFDFMAKFLNYEMPESSYENMGDKFKHEKDSNLETLRSLVANNEADKTTFKGEKVKSLEELRIANFLFINGVEYEYEKPYPKPYDNPDHRRVYKPDFYLPEYDIYLEHYAIDKYGEPPKYFKKNAKGYKQDLLWKRDLHAKHGNKYVESFSWWNSEGVLLERLEAELLKHGVKLEKQDSADIFRKIVENSQFNIFEIEKLICTFLTLFKAAGHSESDFDSLLSKSSTTAYNTARQKLFLKIAKNIYKDYQKELAGRNAYDFSDMINCATSIVERLDRNTLKYKYVIIDEYQDSSIAKMKLIKAVLDNTGAHLFCVGDDWQSIYRFAGSDLGVFLDFDSYYGATKKLFLTQTYRNSQQLIDIAGTFVMRNDSQVKKRLRSILRCDRPIIPVQYGKGSEQVQNVIGRIIDFIVKESKGEKRKVLFLGRINNDENLLQTTNLAKIPKSDSMYHDDSHPHIEFEFLTVHKAKGLEADYVIIINARDDLFGFPNKIADDIVLRLVLSDQEEYDFAEERRLFYVALTRTRKRVFLLVPEDHPSQFVEELLEMGVPSGRMKLKKQQGGIKCPRCQTGHLVARKSRSGTYMYCSNAPRCDYFVNAYVTFRTPPCPKCDGFMIPRRGGTSNGWFLGCSNFPKCNHTAKYHRS